MILDINKAREIGEALLDASENAEKSQVDQAVILLESCGIAVPFDTELQDIYDTVAIIQV
jgi:hypothetical protein|tara:strand:+ start:289 stop:468 length:180 start_codon:yes stop_codon:yes gene_type:complete